MTVIAESVVIEPFRERDLDAVTRLVAAQETRQVRLDPRLRAPRPFDMIRRSIRSSLFDQSVTPIVARSHTGAIRGYAVAGLWDVVPGNEMRGFYAARNGVAPVIAFPPASDLDAGSVFGALLDGLDRVWRSAGTTGEVMSIMSREIEASPEIEQALYERDYLQSFVQAKRPLGPIGPPRRLPPAGLITRPAARRDESALCELHVGEVMYHLAYCPFVRVVPSLDAAFRRQLTRIWAGASPTADAPLVTVVERDGEVVAMAECYVQTNADGPNAGPLPAGRYGYLNSVGVREDQRGQGVGRVLVQAALDRLARIGVIGYTLYFLPVNPLSSRFWPAMGFSPMINRYQRRRD